MTDASFLRLFLTSNNASKKSMAMETMDLGKMALNAEMLIAMMMKETYTIVWTRNLIHETQIGKNRALSSAEC